MTVIRALACLLGCFTAGVMAFTPIGWGLAGLAVFLGVCFLIVVWTCGGFDKDVWFGPVEDDTHPGTLSTLDRLDGVGSRKDKL